MASEEIVINPQPKVMVIAGFGDGTFGSRLALLHILAWHGEPRGTGVLIFGKCNINVSTTTTAFLRSSLRMILTRSFGPVRRKRNADRHCDLFGTVLALD
jgi:hypothetical protein